MKKHINQDYLNLKLDGLNRTLFYIVDCTKMPIVQTPSKVHITWHTTTCCNKANT